jgi:hypothetical protein
VSLLEQKSDLAAYDFLHQHGDLHAHRAGDHSLQVFVELGGRRGLTTVIGSAGGALRA